jgi:hypothetical protein
MEGFLKAVTDGGIARYKLVFAFELYLTELCYKAMARNFEF